ncbi:MAG: hypothetical protein NTV58_15340 [Deltaproteobacteria bacterium]|nr:hypothetical protein [Deltaproteobacteria bacterium]
MQKLRIPLLVLVTILLAFQAYCASTPTPLSRWVTLRSDAKGVVKDIIISEVENREGFSSSVEEKANLNAVEDEKEKEDAAYKRSVTAANREFARAKKRRDDLTTQFHAVSTELEEQQKNIKTITSGIDNLDSQIARYKQDINTQQEALKKWLRIERQGEALVAVIFTQGFKDKAHTLESLADQASAPLMAQYMGTYIQSFTKVVDSTVFIDFIRAVEEGTAKWSNEEPLRIVLEKSNRGTTYLRLKRYELYPFQTTQKGRVKPPAAKSFPAAIITSRKALDSFLSQNGYAPANFDLERTDRIIKETAQADAAAGEGLQEQVRSFHERIKSLQEKVTAAQSERETNVGLLKKKNLQYSKAAQDTALVQSKKAEADRNFQNAQQALYDIRRVHESVIVKTALAAARGSQSPAEVSAEAIIDKLAEVKNDAKVQHSSSTTEVTNFQVSGESAHQAVTEARITAVRLIGFINEGDSVRVKMAFRVRTVLEEMKEEGLSEAQKPSPKVAEEKKSSWLDVFTAKKEEGQDRKPDRESEPTKAAPATREPEPTNAAPAARVPVKRNPKALGAAEFNGVLFEIISAKLAGNQLSVVVEMTNTTEDSARYVALYDENYRWTKSRWKDSAGKEYESAQVTFRKGQQQTSMRDAGSRGVPLEARATQTAQLVFKGVSVKPKTIGKLILHPFVYQRVIFWTWQEQDLHFPNMSIGPIVENLPKKRRSR